MSKRKPAIVSEQLREFINQDERTRYRICLLAGVDQGQLSRFMRGTGRLGQDTMDELCRVLRLRLVRDDE